MPFQLSHEDERRWVMVLAQLEENRIEVLGAGLVERFKRSFLYNQAGTFDTAPSARLLAVA